MKKINIKRLCKAALFMTVLTVVFFIPLLITAQKNHLLIVCSAILCIILTTPLTYLGLTRALKQSARDMRKRYQSWVNAGIIDKATLENTIKTRYGSDC